MHSDRVTALLAALIIAALDECQVSGSDVAKAMLAAAQRMSLTDELTPEVRRFAWLMCGELGLPAVLGPLPPRQWKRRNGKDVTVVLELPSLVKER